MGGGGGAFPPNVQAHVRGLLLGCFCTFQFQIFWGCSHQKSVLYGASQKHAKHLSTSHMSKIENFSALSCRSMISKCTIIGLSIIFIVLCCAISPSNVICSENPKKQPAEKRKVSREANFPGEGRLRRGCISPDTPQQQPHCKVGNVCRLWRAGQPLNQGEGAGWQGRRTPTRGAGGRRRRTH